VDYKLELVLVPVSDVDRAKGFYVDKCGWTVDVDHKISDDFRIVQLTPPGSACSITIGVPTRAAPGTYKATHLMVTDIEKAVAELTGRGVEVGELHHFVDGVQTPGVHPGRCDYESFASFSDPDGNTWVIQERGHA
jgi:catechol 2,3-dioxygenase-like lactoylglutathione lyase family enzyme